MSDIKEYLRKELEPFMEDGNLTEEGLDKLFSMIPDLQKREGYQSIANQLNSAVSQITNSPEGQQYLKNKERLARADRVSDSVSKGLRLALGISDIARATEQIRTGEREADRLAAPTPPGKATRSIDLQRAMETARREMARPLSREVVAPYQQENIDTYLSNLGAARTASGGQAGVYGSLAQNAINQRYNQNLNLIPVAMQARQNALGNYYDLAAQRAQEERSNRFFDLQRHASLRGDYETDAIAAGQAMAFGRENLRDSMYNLGEIAPDVAGDISYAMSPRERYLRRQTQSPVLGDEYNQYKERVNMDYTGNMMLPPFSVPKPGPL